jgi:hypothetical protein
MGRRRSVGVEATKMTAASPSWWACWRLLSSQTNYFPFFGAGFFGAGFLSAAFFGAGFLVAAMVATSSW